MRKILGFIGVLLLQLVSIFGFTFLVSMLTFPYTEDPATQSGNYVLFFGLSITLGVFLAGWVALQNRWLSPPRLLLPRLAGTALGAYLPQVIILLIEKMIPAGHPIFTIAMAAGILGFYLPALLGMREKKPD